MKKIKLFGLIFGLSSVTAEAQQRTYVNPINIDYTGIPKFASLEKHRATAEPDLFAWLFVQHK